MRWGRFFSRPLAIPIWIVILLILLWQLISILSNVAFVTQNIQWVRGVLNKVWVFVATPPGAIILILVLFLWLLLLGNLPEGRFQQFLVRIWQGERRQIRAELDTLHAEVRRYIQPRRISEAQKAQITTFLRAHPPYSVRFEVIANDSEAGNFRADLEQALDRGGWDFTPLWNHIQYVDHLQEGLTIDFYQTMAHADELNRMRPSRRPQTPDMLLRQALKEAGVSVDGGGGGSSVKLEEDYLVIRIGPKRRV